MMRERGGSNSAGRRYLCGCVPAAKGEASMSTRINLRALVLAGVASFLLATAAAAAAQSMTVALSGADEVPPVQTPGKGTAKLEYDPETRQLQWTLEFSDLSAPATMAHFHGPAMPGKNAPPVIWIVEKGVALVSPAKGSAVLTPEQAKDFTSGEWYVNVHTPNNPSGEIRGLIPAMK
jgi:hypothetical protein